MNNQAYLILNGKMLQNEQALVPAANRGMMYGDGCFETFRSYKGKFLKRDAHFTRLKESLDYLDLDVPFSSEDLFKMGAQLLKRNQLLGVDAILRIQCWREGTRGFATSSRKASFLIQVSELHQSNESVYLKVAETRCIPNSALDRRFKLSNGLNYIKAVQEASKTGCNDALMLTVDNYISETTIANLFWIKEGSVFTPSVKCDLLPGITRSIVIELCEKLELAVHVGTYEISDLEQAEAVFRTNSLIELQEVEQIDALKFLINHPVYLKLSEAFKQYKSAELK